MHDLSLEVEEDFMVLILYLERELERLEKDVELLHFFSPTGKYFFHSREKYREEIESKLAEITTTLQKQCISEEKFYEYAHAIENSEEREFVFQCIHTKSSYSDKMATMLVKSLQLEEKVKLYCQES